jgi:hypothetical protein
VTRRQKIAEELSLDLRDQHTNLVACALAWREAYDEAMTAYRRALVERDSARACCRRNRDEIERLRAEPVRRKL